MENVQQPEKSLGENNLSVSTFHYTTFEYKWRIQNVSYMEFRVPYASSTFSAGSEIKCCMVFEWSTYEQGNNFVTLLIKFQLKNGKNEIRVIPILQILSGKGKLKSESKLITRTHGSTWGIVSEKLGDLIDDDDSLTVLCRIKIALDKMTTQSMNLPPSSLVEDLGLMMSSCNLSDVTLVCSDGKELKAHRGMLAARSPVFAAMFSHSMKEAQSGRVEVSDIDSEVMQALLDYVYTDRIPSSFSQQTYKLLVAADKYDLARLSAACERHIMENINISNACDILVAAAPLLQSGLKQRVLQFMKVNIHSIISTDGWSEVVLKCPQALSELSSIE